ncbi:hypothetical protein L3Q82_003321 [Scortum barcoo]|uniref:Uncharacterized protein n=1 Tax=Scortum barcoo TaxID=214431 RepID=A0ACB8VM82_9TELE|nr:hypothetical protein L3Q82_003321 [Scortum barcoo]
MLRRLGSFGVCRPLLRTFYETVVASVVSYAVVCWGGGCSERDKKRLNRLIKRTSSVCGCPLDSIEVMGERRALAKLSTIMDNTSHPLHQTVGALSSSFSNRLRHPRLRRPSPQQTTAKNKALATTVWYTLRSRGGQILNDRSRLKKYSLLCPLRYTDSVWLLQSSFSSSCTPRYLWLETTSTSVPLMEMGVAELEQPVREGTLLSVYCVMERVLIIVHDG